MNNKFCSIHNEAALYYEEDAYKKKRLKIQYINDPDNEIKQALKQLEIKFDQNIQQMYDFDQVLEQLTHQIQQQLQKIKKLVEQHISHIIVKKNLVENISDDIINLQLHKINEQINMINNSQAQMISQLNNQIKELEISTKFDQLYQLLNNFQKEDKCNVKQLNDSKKMTEIEKKSDYQMIQQSSYKQNDWCYAIAFNKDGTIMLAGCDKLIKVFEFLNDQITELQQLSQHQSEVQCLKFMNKSNQFISGSLDSTMIIWEMNQNKQWQYNQVLKGHSNCSWCILLNFSENLLISGSFDKTIKFWSNSNNTWNCNQSIDCQCVVWSISLNGQEDQLIASVQNNQIIVLQFLGKEWIIKQKITVEEYGQRLCYISQNQFVFQPYNRQHLQIFDYDVKDQMYKKGQELQYQNQEYYDDTLFPIQYISQIGIIIVKNGNHIHIIKRNQGGQFTVEQSINFNTPYIYGCMTDDGRYIATWDDKSQEIQIRNLEI